MKQNIHYSLNDNKFFTRVDLIEYCEENESGDHSKIDLFNTAEFSYSTLPDRISDSDYVDPITATNNWIKKLKKSNKPMVLLFSGGLDSIFALDCMIKSNCPPDYLLIYTYNPFDDENFFCSVNMEPLHALEYATDIINKTPELQNTKIWHIRKDKKYAEHFFSDESWLQILTIGHSIETSNHWAKLHGISNHQLENFIFIRGGNFPKVAEINNKLYFYVVDCQLGQIVDKKENKCYDFVLDNPEMFASLCISYNRTYQKDINKSKFSPNTPSYKEDFANKLYLEEFKQFMTDIPPQLDKRFDRLLPYIEDVKINNSQEYYTYLNRTPLKSWLLYLQAELFQPTWFQKYKNAIKQNEVWIKTMHSYPGKITKMIPVE